MNMSETRLFVGNLPDDATDNKIREAFSAFGQIVNLDLKSKSTTDGDAQKKFAFITLASGFSEIESCIRYFTTNDFYTSRLYVTRARESFLERLQRERLENPCKDENKKSCSIETEKPVAKADKKQNLLKRSVLKNSQASKKIKTDLGLKMAVGTSEQINITPRNSLSDQLLKKQESDNKRVESMKQKRREFKEKQKIIKTGLIGLDKVKNKKIVFSDNESENVTLKQTSAKMKDSNKNQTKSAKHDLLFNEDDSDEDINFEIKEQYEGSKGQKVLELQSRYKSDKRFVLDERFIDKEEEENNESNQNETEELVDPSQTDEKAKQLNILQEVLGVAIKSKVLHPDESINKKKPKSKLGMVRFDPANPEHVKFLAPAVSKTNEVKLKKKKNKEEIPEQKENGIQKVEASNEQFYKISDDFKNTIAQSNSFSIRSLFSKDQKEDNDSDKEQDTGFIPLEVKRELKVKNPLDLGNTNPFKYDSSESETEEQGEKHQPDEKQPTVEWTEKLFFSKSDNRLRDGLAFFNKTSEDYVKKGRRDLKTLMKKRLHNKDRKEHMFRKKIGGRKKNMKKSIQRKNK